jgi:hypothetical protein
MARLTETQCRRCGRLTVGGWSGTGELLSVQVTADADPLTPEQELAALVAGCWTWTLHTVAGQLHPRTARMIRLRPAGTHPRQTVHADHRCTPHPRSGT